MRKRNCRVVVPFLAAFPFYFLFFYFHSFGTVTFKLILTLRYETVSSSNTTCDLTQQNAETAGSEKKSVDFIRTIVNEHIRTNAYQGRVVTRFPPEPNGYLHIGHAKAICLNFGLAGEYPGGACHLRMDDTDPTKEDISYVESIQRDVKWLGFDWGPNLFYASDYFDYLYDCAIKLIKSGRAYVCSLSETEIREYRGTVTEAGKDSPYRSRSVAENLDLFTRMKAGEFEDGAHVLRARIDMAAANMKMRDPLLYRIRRVEHYRAGDKWSIYPLYDFAHCLSDSKERITHSICTLEFENNRELYDWILEAVDVEQPRPHQYEFARLKLNYTVMSKRKLLELVEKKYVDGWDDPRLPTLSGYRRRGYTPESIRNFCDSVGMAKSNSIVDIAQLEHSIRDDLNQKVPRVLAVLRPLKLVIENYPEGKTEELDAAYYPHDVPKEGSRPLPFSREIYIERDDFMETPSKNYFRLSPGGEVRLRHAYIITCNQVIKNAAGEVTELRCSYDPDTRSGSGSEAEARKVKGTIHWVSAQHAVKAEIRLYDRLYNVENPSELVDLNPNSLEVITDALVEPSLSDAAPESRYQFERQGYFCADWVDTKPGKPVFNRIVTLRDSWSKMAEAEKPAKAPEKVAQASKQKPGQKPEQGKSERPASPTLTSAQEATSQRYQTELKLSAEEAALIAADERLSTFFEAAVKAHNNPQGIANWILNELLRELKEKSIASLSFGPDALAELVALIDDETISGKIAKDVFGEMLANGGSPKAIVESKGWQQLSDVGQIEPIIDRILVANPDNVAKYKEGRTNLFGFFVGQVLKETGGRANPKLVNDLLQAKLSQ